MRGNCSCNCNAGLTSFQLLFFLKSGFWKMAQGDSQQFQILQPGTILNGYRIEHEIGRGAMAVVYLATQLDLARPVALKVLSAELASDKEYVSRFFNEARAAAALSHPNIIQAYDAGAAEGGIYYFCMEYVEGETMLNIINQSKRVPVDQALTLAREVAEALDYGWQRHKFTHGDIKPENIMVTNHGQAKLADFGLAKIEGHDYDGSDIMLTPLYAPPELIRGERVKNDCRTDIYAFGATLYHAVAGTPPFPGTQAQEVLDRHLNENPEPLRLRNPKTSIALSDFVGKMLQKNPAQRPQSWVEVITGLNNVIKSASNAGKKPIMLKAGQPAERRPVPLPPKKKEASSKIWIWFTAIILAALSGAYLAFVMYPPPQKSPDNPEKPEQTNTDKPKVPAVIQPIPQTEQAQTNTSTEKRQPAAKAAPVKPAATELADTPKPTSAEPATEAVSPVKQEPEAAIQPAEQKNEDKAKVEANSPVIPFTLGNDFKVKQEWYHTATFLSSLKYDLTSQTPVEPMMAAVLNRQKSRPNDTVSKAFMDFIRTTVLPSLEKAKPDIINHNSILKDTQLLNNRQNKIFIRNIAFDSIQVDLVTANGTARQNMAWEHFKTEGFLESLCKSMIARSKKSLNDIEPYLATLVFIERGKTITPILQAMPQTDIVRNWLFLSQISDMTSPTMKSTIEACNNLKEACEEANPTIAAWYCSQMLSEKDIILSDSDKMELAKVLEHIQTHYPYAMPLTQTGTFMRLAKEKEDLNEYAEAITLACITKAFYGRFSFPEKSAINSTIEKNLKVAKTEYEKNINNPTPPPPKYQMAFERAFPPWKANAILLSSLDKVNALLRGGTDRAKDYQKLRKNIEIAMPLARFEMGDWAMRDFFENPANAKLFLKEPLLPEFGIPGAVAFGYAKTIYDDRMSDKQPDWDWLNFINNTKTNQEQISPSPGLMALASSAVLLTHRSPDDPQPKELFKWNPPSSESAMHFSKRQLLFQAFCIWNESDGCEKQIASMFKHVLLPQNHTPSGLITPSQVNFVKTLAEGKLEPTVFPASITPDISWPELRAWISATATIQGLPPDTDEAFMKLVQKNIHNWSLPSSEMLYSWLLHRCAYSLNNNDLDSAIKLTDWVLSLKTTCLIPYYTSFHSLKAGLVALKGKKGGIATAAIIVRGSTVASDAERKFFRELQDVKQDDARKIDNMLKKVPEGKAILYWGRWISTCLRIGQNIRTAGLGSIRDRYAMTKPESTLAKALINYAKNQSL